MLHVITPTMPTVDGMLEIDHLNKRASALQFSNPAEARALAEESDDDWDEDFADGPEIIYAYGDGSEDDDDID